MKFQNCKKSIIAQFKAKGGNRVAFYVTGAPGGGKSSLAREIATELAETFGIAPEQIVEFNPSLREPVDIMGIPSTKGDHVEWCPPEEFYALRKGVGPCVLIIEELSDARIDMQNPLCRVILDRKAGSFALSDALFIICTGNRTSDKSGATRLSTKLGNRLRIIEFTESLDDWTAWAKQAGIRSEVIGFLEWRPELLSKFDPNHQSNPTPRSWADVSTIPHDFEDAIFFEHVKGAVGDGAAAEYCGFVKIFSKLPSLEHIMKNASTHEVPTDLGVLYALSAKFGEAESSDEFEQLWPFIKRMPKEHVVRVMKAAISSVDGLASTKAFEEFAAEYASLL